MLIQTKREDRKAFGRGPFIILRTYPGLAYGDSNDRGIAGLGCIDHSLVSPGFTVKMHEHKNDEIISYERVDHQIYARRKEARQDIFYYIEVWYNRKRRHSSCRLCNSRRIRASMATTTISSLT